MTPDQTLVARSFVASGYMVENSSNGGFIVRKRDERHSGMRCEEAAFTNAADLLRFLHAGHGVDVAPFVIPTELLRTT